MTGSDEPTDFLDARLELDGPATTASGRSSGSTRPGSPPSPASPTHDLDAIAGRWIDLVEEELGELPREEKPWIRELAGQVVGVLPGRRPRAGRALRLVAALTDGPAERRSR